jgi:hypothetical protein
MYATELALNHVVQLLHLNISARSLLDCYTISTDPITSCYTFHAFFDKDFSKHKLLRGLYNATKLDTLDRKVVRDWATYLAVQANRDMTLAQLRQMVEAPEHTYVPSIAST